MIVRDTNSCAAGVRVGLARDPVVERALNRTTFVIVYR